MLETIGKITSDKQGCFKWNIESFREVWGSDDIRFSPDFTYKNRECYLTLWKESESTIKIEICSNEGALSNSLYVEFQARTECNIVSELHCRTFRSQTRETAVYVFLGEFLSEDYRTPLHDRLTVLLRVRELKSCDVLPDEFWSDMSSEEETSDEEETNSESEGVAEEPEDAAKELHEDETDSDYESLKKLQKDLEKLFLNREDGDVTLEVQGIEFPAHRNILQARSPVFTGMFKHKMKETNSGIVTIEDSDPKTFPDFLKYLYTGSTKHISQENVCQLYTTSDKYEVMELKSKCAEFMKCHMTVETFCEYFSLAHMHTEEQLISSGIEFFCAHTIEIVNTAKWQIFLQGNSTVGNELFVKAHSRLLTELSRGTNS